jgi:hypothetical protein
MSNSISPAEDVRVGWTGDDRIVEIVKEDRAQEQIWAGRSANRVRNFVPVRTHVPKHRADVIVSGG